MTPPGSVTTGLLVNREKWARGIEGGVVKLEEASETIKWYVPGLKK